MSLISRLALAAFLLTAAPAAAQAPKKDVATPALQAEFAGFIAKFRAALKANDAGAVAGLTRLPFETEGPARDAAEFRTKVYPKLFTAKTRACVQRAKAEYGRDGLNNDNYFILCGETIFTFTKTAAGFQFAEVGMND